MFKMMNELTNIEFIEILNSCGYLTKCYSGKLTYGKKCVGVELIENQSVFEIGIKLAELLMNREQSKFLESLSQLQVCTDSLGKNKIVYFPEVTWIDE